MTKGRKPTEIEATKFNRAAKLLFSGSPNSVQHLMQWLNTRSRDAVTGRWELNRNRYATAWLADALLEIAESGVFKDPWSYLNLVVGQMWHRFCSERNLREHEASKKTRPGDFKRVNEIMRKAK